MNGTKKNIATLAIMATLFGCCIVPDIDGVRYERKLFGECQNGNLGYWTPGNICYPAFWLEVKEHENCHEMMYRKGMSREQNAKACGDVL